MLRLTVSQQEKVLQKQRKKKPKRTVRLRLSIISSAGQIGQDRTTYLWKSCWKNTSISFQENKAKHFLKNCSNCRPCNGRSNWRRARGLRWRISYTAATVADSLLTCGGLARPTILLANKDCSSWMKWGWRFKGFSRGFLWVSPQSPAGSLQNLSDLLSVCKPAQGIFLRNRKNTITWT